MLAGTLLTTIVTKKAGLEPASQGNAPSTEPKQRTDAAPDTPTTVTTAMAGDKSPLVEEPGKPINAMDVDEQARKRAAAEIAAAGEPASSKPKNSDYGKWQPAMLTKASRRRSSTGVLTTVAIRWALLRAIGDHA